MREEIGKMRIEKDGGELSEGNFEENNKDRTIWTQRHKRKETDGQTHLQKASQESTLKISLWRSENCRCGAARLNLLRAS